MARGGTRPANVYLAAPLLGVIAAPILSAGTTGLLPWLLSPVLIPFAYTLVLLIWAWRGALPRDIPNPR